MDIFSLVYHFSFLSPFLWETLRYRFKYCLKGPLSPNNQSSYWNDIYFIDYRAFLYGWSGGAMVQGKLSVLGRPTNLDNSGALAYCAFSRCGSRLFGHFSFIYHFSFLSPSLWETVQYRLKYCLKVSLNLKQPTNQIL